MTAPQPTLREAVAASKNHSSEINLRATVSDSREVTVMVEFRHTVTLAHPLTTAQQAEFFQRLNEGGFRELLTGTVEWAITGEEL